MKRRTFRLAQRGVVSAGFAGGALIFLFPCIDWWRVWVGTDRQPVIDDYLLSTAAAGCALGVLVCASYALEAWARR